MAKKKNEKRELHLQKLEVLYFEGVFNKDMIDNLSHLLQIYENMGYYDMSIMINRGYDENEDEYELYGTRLETDKEVEARLNKEKKTKEEKKQQKTEIEKKELELLAKLKEKYEK